MSRLSLYNLLAIIGLLGIVLLIVIWNGWLTPEQHIPRSIEILLLVSPQLIFLYGVLRLHYTSHVHITFPALFYFLLGIWYILSPTESLYGWLLLLFSLLQFFGGYLYAYSIMKQDKKQAIATE